MTNGLSPSERPAGNRIPHLAVVDLSAVRGGRTVLRSLSFEVGRGEILGLLGPNGAGKTTAFHLLTGLLPAEGGHIILDGTRMPPGDRRFRERIGVVFQEPALDPRLTARENLHMAARLYGVGRADARARTEKLLEKALLADRAGERISTFSGGMRRRVEIARALIHEPSILVLDEPTTGLDEGAFRATWETLNSLRSSRELSLVLTTHRPEEAELCDRLAIVDGGRLVACDTPERLRDRVRGDLLVLETEDPVGVAGEIERRLGLEPRILDGKVVLERERIHELVPRVVESLPEGTLRSVSMRRTGMGEVFLELTGHELAGDAAPDGEDGR